MDVTESQQDVTELQDGQQQQTDESQQASSRDKDTVQYDTYRRTVGEAKKAKEKARALEARLQELEQQEKQRADEELRSKENYKQLLANREEELAKEKARRAELEGSVTNAIKRDAFLQSLQGSVDPQFHSLIPLEEIAYNPEDGGVDEMSLNTAIEKFRNVYGQVIKTKDVARLPNQRPQGTASGTLDPNADFNKLPAEERARLLAAEFVGK